MSRKKDETGKRYGHWTVLSLDPEVRANRESYWRVRCVCGKERAVRGSHLREGRSISCGCQTNLYPLKEEGGKRYGHLLVLSPEVEDGRRGHWRCQCDCGKERIVRGVLLRNGSATSCGCVTKRGRRFTGPPRPRRAEPPGGYYFDNAEVQERILTWQREEKPEQILAILDKFAPLIKRLIWLKANWDFLDRGELNSDIYVAIWAACKRFVPGHSVYSYFYTVIYYALVAYWRKYRKAHWNVISLDAPLPSIDGEEFTLYDILPAPLIRVA